MRQSLQRAVVLASVCMGFVVATPPAVADETCNSPYISNLIKGQEDFVHVWTLGVEGLGDGSDKLVTVDAKPGSPTYGKVINSDSVEGRNEAHHGGVTAERRQLWLPGGGNSKGVYFYVPTAAAKPNMM